MAGKTLKCTITVKAADNPALATAPFTAKEVISEKVSFVAPKDWYQASISETGTYMYVTGLTEESTSAIMFMYVETGEEAPDYATVKEGLAPSITEEAILAELVSKGYTNLLSLISSQKMFQPMPELPLSIHIL